MVRIFPLPAGRLIFIFFGFMIFWSAPFVFAQEKPYFVTYSHDLEEPGNLEFETKTALAQGGHSTPTGRRRLLRAEQ